MADPNRKSQRRFPGKRAKCKPLKNFTLYLDESFNCQEVKSELTEAHIKFKTYSENFSCGAGDDKILELAGKRGWALLTCDRKNRFRELERRAVLRYRVRQFVFSGNLGGLAVARLLVKIYPQMRDFARKNERPFVAVITVNGNIALRMDKSGNPLARQGASRL